MRRILTFIEIYEQKRLRPSENFDKNRQTTEICLESHIEKDETVFKTNA
jgi:hypothetical protein